MFKDQPIKRKLMLLVMVTSGAVLFLACGTFLTYELLKFRQTMVRQLSTLSRAIAANSTASLAFDNRDDATEVLAAFAADPHIEAAGLYDKDGTLFAKYPANAADAAFPTHPENDGYRFEKSFLVVHEPVVNANRRLGTLYLRSDLNEVFDQLKLYAGLILAVVLMSGGVAFALSNRLQRVVSQPVMALADTARIVTERKDFSVRAERFDGDELGKLTDAFNEMLVQIQRQDRTLREREELLEAEVADRVRAEEEVRALNIELERRVRERTHALETANKELESFSYSVSHDLRAPLRHVQGYVEMLRGATSGQLSADGERYLKTISDAGVAMGKLIDDLLAFSRMGRSEITEITVQLDSLVQDAIRGLEMATNGRTVTWTVGALPRVVGDPAMVRQVFANLIGNAVKYSRMRDAATIEIGQSGEEDGRAVLFVRDNGAGFDMQYAHKLFGVFQRLHRADEFEGTGIGLATVRRIVSRHGGRVWAESVPDKGATFFFTLKLGRAADATRQPARKS